MARIKLTPELLMDCAANLEKVNGKNEDVINRLDNIIATLEIDWEGDAQKAFKDSYNRKRATFANVTLEMKEFVDFLKKFADMMKQEEERQALKARDI